VVLLPVMFPLEFGHNILVGQLWLATIGSRDFRALLKEMVTDALELSESSQWIDNCSVLHAWLDAVAAKPDAFITDPSI